MKKQLILGIALSFLVLNTPAKAEDLKIGVVDFQKALNDVEEGKACKSKLKADFDQKQKSLDVLQNELKSMKDNLEKQKTVLSADAMKQKYEEYQNKFVELQKKLADFRTELQNKEAECTGQIIGKLRNVVQELGAQGKFTVVFEKGQDLILYSPTAVDLTSQAISTYNSKK